MASGSEMEQSERPASGRRIGCWASLAMLLLLVIGLAILWINRERVADNVISDYLADAGVEATYEIEQIGTGRQILRNIVVGDPHRPDLTIERAEVLIRPRFGFPAISEVRLVRPRLYGTYLRGKLSFGALDPLVFAESKEPFTLPDYRLVVEDGRGLLESDYGAVGLRFSGRGPLRSGFTGELAAIAPRLAVQGCDVTDASVYGGISIEGERPAFKGPLRLGRLACADQGIALAGTAIQLEGKADKALGVFDGNADLRTGAGEVSGARLASLAGDARFTWRDGGLTSRYRLAGTGLATDQAVVGRLDLDGSLRARRNFDRVELETTVTGQGVRLGQDLDLALADAADGSRDTLLGPILDRIRHQLAAESRGSRLTADLTVRRTGPRISVVVPEAALRGRSEKTLLSLSRVQFTADGNSNRHLAGSFATGGEGLPRIAGRIQQQPDGRMHVAFAMAPYEAGTSRLEIPEFAVVGRVGGALALAGEIRASGALPGGYAEGLVLPLTGSRSSSGEFALWQDCAEIAFDRLQVASLALDRQRLTLCPPRGTAIVRYGAHGLGLAAGAPALQLAGRLGETPIAIRSGAVGFAWPGTISAKQLAVTLGPAETATSFAVSDLTAQAGADIAGRFDGADVKLYAVPLDLLGASGSWRYADGRLMLADGAFRLVDRSPRQSWRFEPLAAQGATLALEGNQITAEALMREPITGRSVVLAKLRHSLETGIGHADLTVPGLVFDKALQPSSSDCSKRIAGTDVAGATSGQPWLSCLGFGVIANVEGTVKGSGQVDWTENGVTSSGRFSSDSLDLAAAFGPVRGAAGTVEFTDLLNLTTAPDQHLHVASINPGIEALDGDVQFELRKGELLAVEGATWPFMGGTLTMRPLDIRFGASEVRRYVLEIRGLDAARFVQHMELENIAATGVLDGTIPIVFDEVGVGRIEGGLLLSRPPGGNLSYVGQLTYEDLGTMANMAFEALRSLDFSQMSIGLDGNLTGDIVTRVRFDGVTQGAGAKKNIATRALAGLPIRFDVNVRAPFYSLIGNIRAMYDPAAIRDPRDIGLLDAQGNVIRGESDGAPVEQEPQAPPGNQPSDESLIQRRESEETP